ncbi:multiple epidermal growth factor-like domains protein 10 [Ruditapes philippinarum]|uniref:multiple epidermal growth factor-like domains protein 10 n=1 Tax=Ruditapes philippinarum TaxID=129788 RepID=UPI00295C3981|nr:multiple epidermal growth factor-like domains protein 10 [Ruditapes philippinarum]
MMGLTTSVLLILVLVSQFGLSIQACAECACCKGSFTCVSNKNCRDGCIDGYHGPKCTEECLENCKTCFNGYQCTECKPGYYTDKCNLQCGKGCANNTCSLLSGECTCKSSYFTKGRCDTCVGLKYGDECNEACPSNCGTCTATKCSWCINTVFYGSYCQYRCSVGCVDGTCNKGTGHCMNGCKSGYIGDKCDTCSPGIYVNHCDLNCTENCSACVSATNCTECKTGFYGEICTHACPSGCYGNCSRTDGRCFECKPGFVGEYCDLCRNGTYGLNCSKSCHEIDPHCQVCSTNESGSYQSCTECDSTHYLVIPFGYNYSICTVCSRNCTDMVCDEAGLCTKGCVRGKWGVKCNTECARNCEVCDKTNGTCLKCNHNAFSHNCLQICSANCNNTDNGRVCTRDTGKCLHGCKSMTNYGEHCENNCNKACNNKSCDWETGHCLYGCKDGFYGEKCDKKCSSQCVNATCNKVTAACIHGCVDGYEGLECVLAIKGADLEEKKPLVVFAGSAGAGVVVIVLLLILVICLIKRNRRQNLSSNTKCEENDYVLDMKNIPNQTDEPGLLDILCFTFYNYSLGHNIWQGTELQFLLMKTIQRLWSGISCLKKHFYIDNLLTCPVSLCYIHA